MAKETVNLQELPSGTQQFGPWALVEAVMAGLPKRQARPRVILKYAQSIDGRISTATGQSQGLSSKPEQVFTHALRSVCDGILVGVGTVTADNPRLTVRHVHGRNPRRIIVDPGLRIPRETHIYRDPRGTILVHDPGRGTERVKELTARGFTLLTARCESDPRSLDLLDFLDRLRSDMMIETLLVEGGGYVITSFLKARAVDRLVVSVCPRIIGSGRDAVGPLGVSTVGQALRVRKMVTYSVGEDYALIGKPAL